MSIWYYYFIIVLAIPGATWSIMCIYKEVHKQRERETESDPLPPIEHDRQPANP